MKVRSTLTDFANWTAWNPIVTGMNGEAAVGAKPKESMKGMVGAYEPGVTELDAPRSLRWRGTVMAGFLFANEKHIELKETNGQALVTQTETYSGLLIPVFLEEPGKARARHAG